MRSFAFLFLFPFKWVLGLFFFTYPKPQPTKNLTNWLVCMTSFIRFIPPKSIRVELKTVSADSIDNASRVDRVRFSV